MPARRWLSGIVALIDVPPAVPSDPDDDHLIAAAVAGQADLIASGDKRDLLPPADGQLPGHPHRHHA